MKKKLIVLRRDEIIIEADNDEWMKIIIDATKADFRTDKKHVTFDAGTAIHSIEPEVIFNLSQNETQNISGNECSKKACDNYDNGFYSEHNIDLCVNCGQRKGKHEQGD